MKIKTRSGRVLQSARVPYNDVVPARGRDPTPKPIGKQRSDPVVKVTVNTEPLQPKTKTKRKRNKKVKSRGKKKGDLSDDEDTTNNGEENNDNAQKDDGNDSDFERPKFNRKEIQWYNIYSPVSNSYQADLMFMKYEKKGVKYVDSILSMININTRYLLAAVVGTDKKGEIIRKVDGDDAEGWFLENEKVKKKKVSTNKEIVSSYKTRKNRNFGQKTALQTSKALQKILDSLPEEKEKLIKDKAKRDATKKELIKELEEEGEEIPYHDRIQKGTPNIDIDRIFVDEGVEFKKEFNEKCMDNGIKLYVFKKEEGSKRILGIIERSHFILRTLLLKARKK